MIAQRQFAVRLLDLLLGGRLRDAQRAVVVFAHGALCVFVYLRCICLVF